MRAAFSCVFLFLFAGCASSPGWPGTSEFQNVITREQIADSNETTLYDVVDRYHPEWLSYSRSAGLLIVDDDLERLDVGTMRGRVYLNMRGREGVYGLEYSNNILAQSRVPGFMGGGGAIIIRTRHDALMGWSTEGFSALSSSPKKESSPF
jgi:hypothetical protein